ncbi:MAG TPA: hypothetical protein VMY76_17685 [Gemmatimonadales bacterium]|nr:hypothetical protein [Gemmatimonadales bacterium]
MHRFLFSAALGLAACHSPDGEATAPNALEVSYATGGTPQASLPLDQLARAKRAAGRYHDIRKAIADGYTDTGIVLPNMGRHFLKQELMDATFEADRPELLVYTPDSTRLLALEYATPLTDTPPEGFRGSADTWVPFGGVFWTLHAWVWENNPAGVFNSTNARVQ